MEREYSRSTMNHIADINYGVRLDTGVVACATYLTAAAHTPFNLVGRVKINHLFIEAITAWGAQGGTILFNYDAITPAIAAQGLSIASADVSALAQGLRVMFVGGVVGTAAVITATAGVSDVICEAPHIVGVRAGTGYIGYENTGTAMTSGTMQVTVCYTPMEDGAYLSANW